MLDLEPPHSQSCRFCFYIFDANAKRFVSTSIPFVSLVRVWFNMEKVLCELVLPVDCQKKSVLSVCFGDGLNILRGRGEDWSTSF